MAQTFYEQQAANRRTSLVLVTVVGGLLFVVLTGLLALAGLVGIAKIVVPSVWGFALGSYELGDIVILRASRARSATAKEQRQLLNVVREMAVAANIPMPSVYVIDDDAGNALAIGRDPHHASLAVTTGLLRMLDREELQGVVAHEVAHIRTLDTRLGVAVVVLLSGIPFLWDVLSQRALSKTARTSGRRARATRLVVPVALFMIMSVAFLLTIFAPVFALSIRFAIAKEREYLADATSVELTRNPHGLERALSKLATDRQVLRAANRAMRHLFFVDPFRAARRRTFSPDMHPAIDDRIERLRRLTSRDTLQNR